jgi:hypothetical protein
MGRPEAICRLVERALIAEPSAPRVRSKGAPKAAELAGRTIDRLGDQAANRLGKRALEVPPHQKTA